MLYHSEGIAKDTDVVTNFAGMEDKENIFTPVRCIKPAAITIENLDPLTEFLVSTEGVTPPSAHDIYREPKQYLDATTGKSLYWQLITKSDVPFDWDHHSIIRLQNFLESYPDMADCIDILLNETKSSWTKNEEMEVDGYGNT